MVARLTRRQFGIASGVAAVLLAVWLVGLVWFRPWIAHNDFAILRLALERELDGHIRLVGAHSRLGVFHPGPLREWIFVVPYWLSGQNEAALRATALAVNVGWVIWTLAIARRMQPRLWGAACALGLLLVAFALGADFASPWNPHLGVLPLYLACWALVTVIARRGDGWVACICAGSFAAQMHASALVVAGGLLAAALTALAVQRERDRLLGAVGVALVLWSGPIIDLRKGSGANLVRLRTVGADGDSVGVADATGHVSRLLWPGTPWSRDSVRPSVVEFAGFHRWWLVLVVSALVGVAVVSWRAVQYRPAAGGDAASGRPADGDEVGSSVPSPDPMAMTACMVAIGVVVAAVVSISMFVEPVYRYLYGPLQAAAVFALAALLGAAIVTVRSPGSLDVPHVEWVALAVVPVAVLGVVMTIPREDADTPGRRDLRVEAVVGMALDERPGWEQVEGVQLDFRGIGDLEAEVLDVVDRSGRDARSRRSELGLPAPDRVDGVFVVAMDPNRDCFASEPDVAEILTGTSGAGETFSVYAVDRASSAYDRCLRP